jgi:predicted AlkP superfamily phosphohydrolase/phosphomutase
MTTLVLGLDGASFELLGPWMEEGALPNLQRLAERGVAEDMQSCLPPVTCPNWQCYATGTNPGKLGVFWWEAVDREASEVRNTSGAGQFDGRHYWTLLDGDAAVVNLPTSYPPPEIDELPAARN